MEISKFLNEEYIGYCSYDNYRSIGNVIDGLKPSSRKVIYTARKQNVKNNIKVSIFASDAARATKYLHGNTSLEGVVVGLAQNFAGTNNVNLLKPEGSFGTRCIPKSAESRYIFTKKNECVDKTFSSDDDALLITQEFEGSIIEPKFFVPIIPLILVNGSEGIGNGFAQKILSRNPIDIIKKIQNLLNAKKDSIALLPYFNGFAGSINKTGDTSYEIKGVFEKTNTTTITITELPLGYDLEKYNTILSKLEDDKIISSYTDKSEGNNFLFEVKVPREFVKQTDEYILDKLKLIKKVTENFTCLGINNEILEFKSEMDILDYYVSVRLDYYAKRKEYLINKLKKELMICGSKYWFVKAILEDKIKVFKQPKSKILEQIEIFTEFKFFKVDDGFDYLTRMQIISFSKETIEEMKKQIIDKKEELKYITEKSKEQMWLDDLEELKKVLK